MRARRYNQGVLDFVHSVIDVLQKEPIVKTWITTAVDWFFDSVVAVVFKWLFWICIVVIVLFAIGLGYPIFMGIQWCIAKCYFRRRERRYELPRICNQLKGGCISNLSFSLCAFRYRATRERLERLRSEMAERGREQCTTCAICLEDFQGTMDGHTGIQIYRETALDTLTY